MPSHSITPQPVRRRPGSMPIMRFARVIPCWNSPAIGICLAHATARACAKASPRLLESSDYLVSALRTFFDGRFALAAADRLCRGLRARLFRLRRRHDLCAADRRAVRSALRGHLDPDRRFHLLVPLHDRGAPACALARDAAAPDRVRSRAAARHARADLYRPDAAALGGCRHHRDFRDPARKRLALSRSAENYRSRSASAQSPARSAAPRKFRDRRSLSIGLVARSARRPCART